MRFCVIILALRRFPRGVRWGEMWKPHCGRAPDCAKESSTLWTLFIWVVMWVRFTRGRRCGYNGELAGHSWIEGSACEVSQFQVLELIKMSAAGKKIIVDTNLTIEMLREVSDYGHVAVMLSPQTISAERFFDRSDEDKQFLLSVIDGCPDPKWAEDNFRACIAKVNRPEIFEAFENSGFAVFKRDFSAGDTRQEMLDKLAKHFGLK